MLYKSTFTLLLRKLRDMGYFIIGRADRKTSYEFLSEFFKQNINEEDIITEKIDSGYLLRNSLSLALSEEYAEEISKYEWGEILNDAIFFDIDEATFLSLVSKAGYTDIDEDLLSNVLTYGKPFMIDILLSKLKTPMDLADAIERISNGNSFNDKIDIIKKHYPEFFTSSYYGFLMLSTLLEYRPGRQLMACHNYGTEEYYSELDHIMSRRLEYLLGKVHPLSIFGCDNAGNTLLHIAAKECKHLYKTFDIILGQGIDTNATSFDGSTPLHYAFDCRYITERLLAEGADPNIQDSDGNTPLHLCAEETVDVLLSHCADPNVRNDSGNSPLMEQLKELGIYSHVDSSYLGSIYQLAEYYDETEYDRQKRNAFMIALDLGIVDEKLIDIMLSKTSDIDHKDWRGWTLLHYIVSSFPYGKSDLIDMLLKAGADPYALTDNNETVLFPLIYRETLDEAEYSKVLIKFPNDLLNKQDINGDTILHLAVEKTNTTLIKALVNAGADTTIRNNENKTPVELCEEIGNRKLRKLIMKSL